MLTQLAIAAIIMAGLGVLLAVILAIANKKLYVEEDPRIDEVEGLLPNANCGACGEAGCRAFAEKVVEGTVNPSRCPVNSAANVQAIADLMGITAEQLEKRVARLACQGGNHVARVRAKYTGMQSCRAADLISGGGKDCPWGCLGFGDCEVACQFDAIRLDEHGLPHVNEDKCTACGDCVEVCPRDLYSIHPISHRLWVACKNEDDASTAEAYCEVACIGCGRCALDAPDDLITIRNNLAVIDYNKNASASEVAIQRCPTGAIVWIDPEKGYIKGAAAHKVTRKRPLPVG
jgi:RnfABCDGE-type electron transport complex B subunit